MRKVHRNSLQEGVGWETITVISGSHRGANTKTDVPRIIGLAPVRISYRKKITGQGPCRNNLDIASNSTVHVTIFFQFPVLFFPSSPCSFPLKQESSNQQPATSLLKPERQTHRQDWHLKYQTQSQMAPSTTYDSSDTILTETITTEKNKNPGIWDVLSAGLRKRKKISGFVFLVSVACASPKCSLKQMRKKA